MRALAVFHCVTPMKIWDSMEQKTNKGSMEHKTKQNKGSMELQRPNPKIRTDNNYRTYCLAPQAADPLPPLRCV
jgi:hypothetical protein